MSVTTYLGLDPASTALVELEQRWFITGTSPGFGCEMAVQLLERSDRAESTGFLPQTFRYEPARCTWVTVLRACR
jgi:hypothetical protein